MPGSRIHALAFLLLFPLAAAAQPPAPLTQFIQRAWGTDDGLPQNSITALAQTRDGYLWLGTFGGLVRFDGHAFTVFDPANAPALGSGRITALLEARDGSLWIGTESGLARLQDGRFASHTAASRALAAGVTALLEDRGGRLWAGTTAGLARFDGQSVATFPHGVTALAETRDGTMWTATARGVARLDANGTVTPAPEWVNPPAPVTNLFVDSKGRLWATTATKQPLRLDPQATRFVEVPLPTGPGGAAGLAAISEGAGGIIWLGTGRNGVYRWEEGRVGKYDAADGLPDNNARAVLEDRNGNLWVGTNLGGIVRLKRRHVWSYELPAPMEPSIAPIVGDGEGGLWIGGNCAGLLHFRDGAFRLLGKTDGRPGTCLWALFRDPDGTLWVGAPGAGLLRRRQGRIDSFNSSNGLSSNEVYGIARDRDGVLWVGTTAGVSRMREGGFVNYGVADGLDHDVRAILQDRTGRLWFGGANGLSTFRDGRFTRLTAADGLSHPHVRAFHEDADGTIWIGTYGGGLNRFKDGRFTVYSIKDGLPDSAVSRIIEDDRGNLWMSGNKGVFRVARAQLNAFAEGRVNYLTSVTYGTTDGMTIAETNGGQPAGWRTKDGRLWFPTIKGLVGIEPPLAEPPAPPAYIERVAVNGAPAETPALVSLGPGRADLEFHYTAVDLTAAEKTRFKYRLDGYDAHWIDSGDRRVAYFTNIPPGSYHFEVLATNSEGAWSETPGRLALTVVPFWWQRQGVQAMGLLLLLVATGFGVRFVSLRRARARVAELERERALDRERSRIARDLHDDLGSRLTLIAMMADSPSEAASGRVAQEARGAAEAMDELVWAVNARNDTVEGFAYYLAQFAEEHIVAAGVRCRMLLPAKLPDRPLAADARRHLYLACKEAVNNAVKHAAAGEIRVSLAVEDTRLRIEIADDGRGLPGTVDPTGNGLKNYRERMKAAGGTVEVVSAPNLGTSVTFCVPV